MARIFENGITRARVRAWGCWLAVVVPGVGWLLCSNAAEEWRTGLAALLLTAATRLFLVRVDPKKLPVLNYHSVSRCPEWLWIPAERLSLPPEALERQFAYLKRKGYRSVFVSEACDLLAGTPRLDRKVKHVALTFDDGYADNWIAVFPLLKKYGVKATIFVCTDFIGDADVCRPTLEERDARDSADLDWSGYLTWPELRAMRASGLVEVQSHGSAHARVFTGPELRGFVGPGRTNPWLLWERQPQTRLCWWQDTAAHRLLWGHPVFRQGPALACRAWRPDPESVAQMLALANEGAGALYDAHDWEQRLRAEWELSESEQGRGGSFETDDEFAARVEADLRKARLRLESKLGARIDVLCWPENAFTERGEEIERRLGYRCTVSNRHDVCNVAGGESDRIVRVFIGSRAAGFQSRTLDFAGFRLELKVFEGWYVLYPLLALLHVSRKMVFASRSRWKCRTDYFYTWGC